MKTFKQEKIYYSIREVADMFNVNESLLRYWEKKFPSVNPTKTAKGTRQYKKEDIEAIRLIYNLVKRKGMTLAGATKRLKENKEEVAKNEELISRLENLKSELMALRNEMDALEGW
ncbi:MAG: MerR family transcriptional regulator [Dysgonamonadaceae bacterium]|jgi:DNA-binding transcriptional MerR regulator|nr:MerR family transcriptional regulator [Dysgonamonadaceae bacterium]